MCDGVAKKDGHVLSGTYVIVCTVRHHLLLSFGLLDSFLSLNALALCMMRDCSCMYVQDGTDISEPHWLQPEHNAVQHSETKYVERGCKSDKN